MHSWNRLQFKNSYRTTVISITVLFCNLEYVGHCTHAVYNNDDFSVPTDTPHVGTKYLCYVAGTLLAVTLLAGMVSFIILEKNTSTTALGIAGDVVILEKANNWLSIEWSASECLKSGDYYKITDLSVVLKDSLINPLTPVVSKSYLVSP